MSSSSSSLLRIAVIAGLAQVVAGLTMYFAGVYFAPWSMAVSLIVLLTCIILGVSRHRDGALQGGISYAQALGAGAVISLTTGVLYAIYNVVTVQFVYDDFLGQIARITGHATTLPALAIGNLVRLTVFGTVLSGISAAFLKRTS